MPDGLEACPTCGARLMPALVAAMRDPRQEESCPGRRGTARVSILPTPALLDAIRQGRPGGGDAA